MPGYHLSITIIHITYIPSIANQQEPAQLKYICRLEIRKKCITCQLGHALSVATESALTVADSVRLQKQIHTDVCLSSLSGVTAFFVPPPAPHICVQILFQI